MKRLRRSCLSPRHRVVSVALPLQQGLVLPRLGRTLGLLIALHALYVLIASRF